jgi:hypothetical protein
MGLLEAGGAAEHGRERWQRQHRYPISGVHWRRKCSSDANLRARRPITTFGSPPRLEIALEPFLEGKKNIQPTLGGESISILIVAKNK